MHATAHIEVSHPRLLLTGKPNAPQARGTATYFEVTHQLHHDFHHPLIVVRVPFALVDKSRHTHDLLQRLANVGVIGVVLRRDVGQLLPSRTSHRRQQPSQSLYRLGRHTDPETRTYREEELITRHPLHGRDQERVQMCVVTPRGRLQCLPSTTPRISSLAFGAGAPIVDSSPPPSVPSPFSQTPCW